MIKVIISGVRSGKIYATGTAEEVHQFLLKKYPALKKAGIHGKGKIIKKIYPEPLRKTRVRE
ncbi:hypothetical protein [Tetragenococcus koreensis]|uniref:hypothetical protein n=1 Tax=Tetragenococcus koreensis TaxID=290335 RepID=UPI001F1654C6|nr:hypothetical protein [Tetragenococcus koreensis]MCF1632922.1 hypothetical protein [Tetragenococcus koreensis]